LARKEVARIVKDSVNAVVEQIERDKDYLIDLTGRLVRIPTVNPKFESNPEIRGNPSCKAGFRAS
jgi:acetylornithine deacetylase